MTIASIYLTDWLAELSHIDLLVFTLLCYLIFLIYCFHTRAKCAIEWSFELQYFGLCVCKITSRCEIWIAQLKLHSRCVFQWRISQITQRNHCMNALTSNLWFGGGAMWPITTSPYIPRATYVQQQRKCELCACLIGRVPRHKPCIFSYSGMLNRKFGLSCVHCVIQISQLLLLCVHCVIQIAHFEW